MEPTVDERDFYAVLARLRDVRAWAVATQAEPWAFRQAMITIMAIDTAVALERGVKDEALARFDELACTESETLIMAMLQEGRARGR